MSGPSALGSQGQQRLGEAAREGGGQGRATAVRLARLLTPRFCQCEGPGKPTVLLIQNYAEGGRDQPGDPGPWTWGGWVFPHGPHPVSWA